MPRDTQVRGFRLPIELLAALKHQAEQERRSATIIVEIALEQYFARAATEKGTP